MRGSTLGFVTAAALLASGCVGPGDGSAPGYAGSRAPSAQGGYYAQPAQGGYYAQPAPGGNEVPPAAQGGDPAAQGGYYADRDYRADPQARDRRLAADDRVYRGRDGRYYCHRSNGTTGMVVGAVVGGILGNIIAPGGSALLGTLLGGGGGAVAGKAIDKHNSAAKCR